MRFFTTIIAIILLGVVLSFFRVVLPWWVTTSLAVGLAVAFVQDVREILR